MTDAQSELAKAQNLATWPNNSCDCMCGRSVHYCALQIDDACRALNGHTMRYESSKGKERLSRLRGIRNSINEIRRLIDAIDRIDGMTVEDLAGELAGELGVDQTLEEGTLHMGSFAWASRLRAMNADEINLRVWATSIESDARTIDAFCEGGGLGRLSSVTDSLRLVAAEMRIVAAKQEITVDTGDMFGVGES